MTTKYKLIDNLTSLFIFIMTCAVVYILSVAQQNNINLSGKNLFLFILGFLGSIICIMIRFVILYFKAIQLSSVIKKLFMIIYLTIWCILSVVVLVIILQLSNFSTEHQFLFHYNAYQIFMLVILLAQWLGAKLF